MTWTVLRVEPGDARDAALAALFEAGSQGVHEDGASLVTHFPPGADVERAAALVREAAPHARVSTAAAADIDWTEAWKERLRVHELGSLDVAPPWLVEGRDPSRTIVIEPGMAFGTGEHPTTRGVVRLMQRVMRPGDVVADLGAGSAVLAIAAAKLGARRVAAVEIDPDAIGNAEENVARNAASDRVFVVEGDAQSLLPLLAPVDVVVANIISSVLLALLPAIRSALAPEGRVILSGILAEERESMLEALGNGEWRVLHEDREDIWWTVALAAR